MSDRFQCFLLVIVNFGKVVFLLTIEGNLKNGGYFGNEIKMSIFNKIN